MERQSFKQELLAEYTYEGCETSKKFKNMMIP